MKKLNEETKDLLEGYRKYAKIQGTTEYGLNDFLTKEGYNVDVKVEVGKWYIAFDDNDTYIFNHQEKASSYGFFRGEWNDGGWNTSGKVGSWGITAVLREATNQEVEDALIKEAKKRGFKEGVRYDAANVGYPTQNNMKILSDEFDFYDNRLNIDNWLIFKEGKWAEVVKETPKKEMTIAQLEESLGFGIKIIK